MIDIRDLSKTFVTRAGELTILQNLNLALASAENIAITGPSGCGKSTLLNILGLLEPPTAGVYRFGDDDVLKLDAKAAAAFRNRKIGFVFQDHHLLPQCNVLENVLIPTLVDTPAADVQDRARETLSRVGLSERLDHRPAELSGGERQRVALARALINQPTLLIADEPPGNLDPRTANEIADLLLEVQRATEAILIVVTHSRELAARFSRRLQLVDGQLQEGA